MNQSIGIIGATGNVGRKIAELIIEKKIVTPENLKLFSSKSSAGKTLSIKNHSFPITNAEECDFRTLSLCLLATDSDISKVYIAKALAENTIVVDSSSLHRLAPDVPLIVGPVNKNSVNIQKDKLYAMANCITSPVSVVLSPLQRALPLKRVNIVTYQSTSGAGKSAMDELQEETKSIIEGNSYQRKHFGRQIAFNIIPQIDKILEDGYTYEEFKIMHEIKKVLLADFSISATSVRVPVMIGHSSVVSVEFEKDFDLTDISSLLSASPGIKISPDHYTTPVEAAGTDEVYVGRIRRDTSVPYGIHLWLCSDNLRRGAATDVVEVAEEIMQQLRE